MEAASPKEVIKYHCRMLANSAHLLLEDEQFEDTILIQVVLQAPTIMRMGSIQGLTMQ